MRRHHIRRLFVEDDVFYAEKTSQLAYGESWLLMNYLLQSRTWNPRLVAYLKALAEFNAKKITNYQVTLEKKDTVKGKEFTYLESKGIVSGLPVKFLCWYTAHGDSIYNITYTEPEDNPEGAKAMLQPVLESLTWNP